MPLTDSDILNLPDDTGNNPLVPKVFPSTSDNTDKGSTLTMDQIMQQEISKVPESNGLSPKDMAPTISVAERNANKRYKYYTPGLDNEELAAINQKWYSQLANSTVKGLATAAGTFLDGMMTFPDAISAVKSGNISGLYQSPLETSVDTWLQNLEDKFPNYYTKWEKDHPFLSAVTPTGFANFWGENIIKNLGFTVGAIGSSLAQDAIIGAATGGIGAVVNIPAQVGKAALWLNKLFTVTKDADKVLEGISDAGKILNFAKLRQAAKLSQGVENVLSKAQYTTSLLGAARTEAGFEARQGYNDLKNDLIQEYKDAHGGSDPDAETLAEIEKTATASANVRFGINMAILVPSDAIQFDAIFNMFNAERKGLASSLGLEIGGGNKIKSLDNTLGGIDKLSEVKPKGLFARFVKPKDAISGILSEGFYEEGFQNVAQEGTYNYYHNKYNDNTKDTFDDILKSTIYGFSKTYGSEEGWENVVAGALMSLITTPATERFKKKANNKALNDALTALNNNTLTGSFEDKYKSASVATQASQDMKSAAQNGDLFAYKNLKHRSFFNFITSALNVGRYDVRMEQLNMLKQLSDEDFNTLFGMDPTDENRKTSIQYVDNLISKAEEIKQNYNAIKYSFPNPYTQFTSPKSEDEVLSNVYYNLHNEYTDTLSYLASINNDVTSRLNSIKDKWTKRKLTYLNEDVVSQPFTQGGLKDLSEKYRLSGDTTLADEIDALLPKLQAANFDFDGKEELYDEFISTYNKIINKETNTPIHPSNIREIAFDGGDIARIKKYQQDALNAYNFLSTSKGKKAFIDNDNKEKEKQFKKDQEKTSKVPKKSKVKVKYGQTDREAEIEEDKNYYLFLPKETPEKVPLREVHPITVKKINDDGSVEVTKIGGTSITTLSPERLSEFELFSHEEMNKTDKGKKYLDSLRKSEKYSMNINGTPVTGNLYYTPSNDRLDFVYWDNNAGKLAYRTVKLEQFSDTYDARYKITKVGTLQSNEQLSKLNEEQLKRDREQGVKDTRDAIDDAILEHEKDINSINKKIENRLKKIEANQKKLNDLISSAVNEVDEENVVTPLSDILKIRADIQKKIRNTQKDIDKLQSTKDQLEYNLDYLRYVRGHITDEDGDMRGTIASLKEQIADINVTVKDIQEKISRLNNFLKIAKNAIKKAEAVIDSLLNSFKRKNPSYRPEEIEDVLNGKYGEQYIPEDLVNDINTISEGLGENRYKAKVNKKKVQTLLQSIKEQEDELKMYQKEHGVLSAHLQALLDKVDKIAAEKRKQEELERDTELRRQLFKEGRHFSTNPETNPPTNPPDEDPSPSEPKKKDVITTFRSTTSDQLSETSSPATQRLNEFFNHTDHQDNRPHQRIVLVTKNNEDALNLTGLTQSEWDRATSLFPDTFKPEDITNENTGVILSVFIEEDPSSHKLFFINKEGKRIGEVGKDSPSQDEIIFSHMPTSSKSWLSGGNRFRKDVKPEEIDTEIASWRQKRNEIFSNSDIGPVYEFNISEGFSRGTPGANINTISSNLTNTEELDTKQVVFVPTNNNFSRRGKDYNINSGRPVLSNNSYFSLLKNRKLTENEKATLFAALKELAVRFEQTKKLDQEIINSINGIIFFGTNDKGQTTYRNQIGIGHGTLNLGEKNTTIPFTSLSIEQNKDLIYRMLSDMYNTVTNYKLKDVNKPYKEIYLDKNGSIKFREWRNYQQYLLSPTYELTSRDDSGFKGTRNDVPLTTSIDPVTTENPVNFDGRYAVLQSLYETKSVNKPTSPAVTPTPQPSVSPQSTITISSKVLGDLKIPYTLSEPIAIEGKEGQFVSIAFDKTSPDADKLIKYQKGKGRSDEQIDNIFLSSAVKELLNNGVLADDTVLETEEGNKLFQINENNPEEVTEIQGEIPDDPNNLSQSEAEILAAAFRSNTKSPPNKAYRVAINPNNIPAIGTQEWREFEDYMRKNLPQFTTEQLHHLITMTGGGFAYGEMEDNLIKVFTGAPKGTEYHEAFEGVWAHFTTPEMREKVFKQLRNNAGSFFDILSGNDVSFKDATDEQLKEWAADKFGEYVYNKKNAPRSSLLKRIFDAIINWFKNRFIHRDELTKLFQKIDSGYFKDFSIINTSPSQFKPIPGLNSITLKDINDEITSTIINEIFSQKGDIFNVANLTSDQLYNIAKEDIINLFKTAFLNLNDNKDIPWKVKERPLSIISNRLNAVNNNWDDIVSQHKEIMKIYGVEFNDNGGLEANDENRNFREYDKDYYKIDNLKSAPTAIKLLMATLAVRVHGDKIKSSDVFGEPNIVPSTIGGVNLVPFGKAFVTVMDRLAGSDTLEEMMDNLSELATDQPEFISLFKRLGGNLSSGKIDYGKLNSNQWRLLMKFYNTFSRQQPEALLQYVNGEDGQGGVYTQNASKNNIIKAELKNWMEGIKAKALSPTSIIYYQYNRELKKGEYKVVKSKIPTEIKSKDGSKEVNFLNTLGIDNVKFDAVKNMKSGTLSDFKNAVYHLHEALTKNKNEGVPLITSKSLNIEGSLNDIARAYLYTIFEEPASVFFDENGEYRNNYVLHNRVSKFASAFNKIKNIKVDLARLLPHVAGDVFSNHSVVLHSKDGLWFKSGSKVSNSNKLSAGYIMASINSESNRPQSISNMPYGDRVNLEFNQNINGRYYFINSVDSNTEHLINLGNYIRYGNLNINEDNKTITSDISNTFKGYILDEVGLIAEKEIRERSNEVLRNAKGTERGADKLRFTGQILSTNEEGRKLLEKIYKVIPSTDNPVEAISSLLDKKDNEDQLRASLKKYFKDRTNETKEALISTGIITRNESGLILWKNLDDKALNSKDFSSEIYRDGSSEKAVDDLISWIEVNYAINNIEMHKLILGDPFQRKAKDEVKRIKLQLSPANSTYHEDIYDNLANDKLIKRNTTNAGTKLQKGELGYVHPKNHVNTSTVNDITSISRNSITLTTNEEVNKVHALYTNTDETDSGAWGAPWFHKQFEDRQGNWSPDKEQFYQDDAAWARYELSQDGLYTYTDEKLKAEDKEIAERLSSEPFNDKVVLSVIKPIARGPKNNIPHIDNVSDKYSIFPLSYGIARRYPHLKTLYLRMFNSKREDGSSVDYVICKSGRKIGTDISDNLYNEDGSLSTDPFESDVQVGYDILGIITPVDYKEAGKVTEGTQIRNLIIMDLMENGVPITPEVGDKIDRYTKVLNQKVDAGFQHFLTSLGIDEDLKLNDKSTIAKLLQNEIFRRQLPDNIKDAIRLKDGEFVYHLEATNSYNTIMGIIMSKVDKSFISNKVNGLSAVEVPVTLFEKGHRKFAYKEGDKWVETEDPTFLTSDQKKTLVAVADTLKFYEPTIDENGDIQSVARCEIALSSKHIRSRLSSKLNQKLDNELIDYLNNTNEGQKILQGVAFRIPTSGLNLMESFTIKEFLPDFYGDTVVIPSELTKKTGTDFDIDKLNIYLKNTYVGVNGDLKLAPYFSNREDSDKFYGAILDNILDKQFKNILVKSSKVADKLEILKNSNVIDNWELFKRNEKYFTSFMEEVGNDDELFDNKVRELDNKLNALEERGIQLNDEQFRKVYKEDRLEEFYLKGIENEMFESMEDLILDKNNYLRLITPNDSSDLIKIKGELNDALGIKKDIPAPLLNRKNLSTIRHNNLVGKTRVGVYSLSQVYNAMMQSNNTVLDPSKVPNMSIPDEFKDILLSGSKLTHNKVILPDGTETVSFGSIKTADKKNYISDFINVLVSGAVDMPSDQSLSEVGFVEQRAPVGMAMVRAGIDKRTVIWMLNQPIIRELVNWMNQNGRTNFTNKSIIEQGYSKFQGGKDVNSINEKSLKSNIEDYYKNNKKFTLQRNAEQRAILREFLYYASVAQELFGYNMALNYDRANFSDTTLIADKDESTNRALDNNIITGIQDVLDNTFIGRIRESLQKSRDALGSFLSLEKTGVRDYIDAVSKVFSQPGMFVSSRNKVKIGKSIKTAMIDYLVQTKGLNQEIERILVNDKTSIANAFQKIKLQNKKEYNTLSQNPVIKGLNILSEAPNKGVINLSFNKKNMDPNDGNILTEGFRELKNNIYIRQNNLYNDIVKLAILQSGTDNSDISFTQFIPVEDFAEIVNPAIGNVENADLLPFVENGNFFRNNWGDSNIVPQITERKTYDPILKAKGVKKLIVVPYGNVPTELKDWADKQKKGTLIGLTDRFNNRESKYPFVKISIPINPKAKKKTYITSLYQQVKDEEGNPLVHLQETGTKVYIYKQVNAWGNKRFAREHHTSPQPSVINNGTVKINTELHDADIIDAYQNRNEGIIQASPKTVPTFKRDTGGGTKLIKTYIGKISSLRPNQIFVFGSNPEGRHGAGAALLARNKFGAKYGQGRGLQGKSYGLVTKNLKAGYTEPSTGITYEKSGKKSLDKGQIVDNIRELYNVARNNPDKEFLIAYTIDGKNLNGYSAEDMADMFSLLLNIPSNVVFEEGFSKLLTLPLSTSDSIPTFKEDNTEGTDQSCPF